MKMISGLTCEVWLDIPVRRIRRKSQMIARSLRTHSIKEKVKPGMLLERDTSVEYLRQGWVSQLRPHLGRPFKLYL